MQLPTNAEILNRIREVHADTLNLLAYDIAVYCTDSRVSIDDAIEVNWDVLNADVARDDRACIVESIEYVFETMRKE